MGGWRRNSQAWVLTVALHGTIVALLAVGWTLELAPVNAPSVLKTRLITLPAQPQVAPAAQLLAVEAPVPVIEAPPKGQTWWLLIRSPGAQTRTEVALARKRVAERKQTQQVQEALQAQQAQPLIHAQQRGAEQARLAVANAQRTQQPAAVADVRQYLPISKEAPDYPQRALDKGIEGDCTVEYSVTPKARSKTQGGRQLPPDVYASLLLASPLFDINRARGGWAGRERAGRSQHLPLQNSVVHHSSS